MRQTGLDPTGRARGIKDALRRRVENPIERPAFQHANQRQVPGAVRCEHGSPGGTVASVNTGVLRVTS